MEGDNETSTAQMGGSSDSGATPEGGNACPPRFCCAQDVLSYVQSNYASMFARKQLLNLFLGETEVDLKSLLSFNLPLVEHLQWMCDKSVEWNRQWSSVFTCDRVLELIDHAIADFNKMVPSVSDAVRVIALSRQYLCDISTASLVCDYNMEFAFRFLALSMDLIEKMRTNFTSDDQANIDRTLEEFFATAAGVITKCNTYLTHASFSQVHVFHWSEILKNRPGFPSEVQKLIEVTVNESFLKLLKDSKFNLLEAFSKLPGRILCLKQKYPNKDTTGLESLFNSAIIESMDGYMRGDNAYNWDPILGRDSKMVDSFMKIAEEQCPKIGTNDNAYDCVSKVLQWKPFLQLYDLSCKMKQASDIFGNNFKEAKLKFCNVLRDIQKLSISFSNFTRIYADRTAFTNVCVHFGVETDKNIDEIFKKCSVISEKTQKCFFEISQLKELVNKFSSQVSIFQIDIREYNQMVDQWKDLPLNQFVEYQGSFPVAKPGFLSHEYVEKINNYTNLMKSRLFSSLALKSVKKFCEDLKTHCSTQQLFDDCLSEAEEKFLESASKINSGHISAKAVQLMFEKFDDRIKVEELQFLKKMWLQRIDAQSQHKGTRDNFEERRNQILKLNSVDLNRQVLQTLFKLKEALNLQQKFSELDVLHRSVSKILCKLFSLC